jgi:uncharacterized protein (DUF2062 family)
MVFPVCSVKEAQEGPGAVWTATAAGRFALLTPFFLHYWLCLYVCWCVSVSVCV